MVDSISPSQSKAARPGSPIELRRLLGGVRKGRHWITASMIVSLILGAVAAKTIVPREYESAASLVWEPASDDEADSTLRARELKTLVESVKLPPVLSEVRRRLRIKGTLSSIGKRIDVESSDDSNLVVIRGRAASADEAARFTEALVDAFLSMRTSAERERLYEHVRELESRVVHAKRAVANARNDYQAFRTKNHLSDLPAETQVAIEQAARMRSEADEAKAEADAEAARSKSLESIMKRQDATTVLSETESHIDTRRLAEVQTELALAKSRLSDQHPKVRALEAEVTALARRSADPSTAVRSERIVGRNPTWDAVAQGLSISKAQRDAALSRYQAYATIAENARTRLEQLSGANARAADLLARTQVTESHLVSLEGEHARALDAARAASAGFRKASSSFVPEQPSKSFRRVVVAVSPFLGIVLSLSVLLLRSLSGLRVFTPREVAYWGNGPVVASSGWPGSTGAVSELVADLGNYFETAGDTLLVPLSSHEREHAIHLKTSLEAVSTRDGGRPTKQKSVRSLVMLDANAAPQVRRRTARDASRVLVVVQSGMHSAAKIASFRNEIGREGGVGYIVIGVGADLADVSDHAGDLAEFWGVVRRTPGTPARG